MKLYSLLEQVSDILTPTTHGLYEYLLHSSDDHGFLRTKYCYHEEPLQDHRIPELNEVLIIFRRPFAERDDYYDKEGNTLIKLQLFYDGGDIDDAIEWSRQHRYTEACVINLQSGTASWKHYGVLT